ncbi:hypothetical protein A2116_01740 [Candidatus Jorgensenbacteria bacterium GWA1_49_17]|uniref:isoleucine--tRNA ligase n=1 Tax=Candidatus Jorgensenbacteria bacterium GWA1_49_17 TaxID=1798467 RepID=A0A1F6BT94_9BACT|nr:MAG: hypothetical protein A2116_01740 [Candidatus Jorgensenbacteria bacterium GWA1_49_17]
MLRKIKDFSPPEIEEKILKFWDENRVFEKSLEKTKKGKPFTFYDGPPFATGLPHYGHILASTIKDVIPRYQTMRGRFVRRRWGWDCHGLPIEEIVERYLGISGKKEIERIGIGKFNATCRSKVLGFADEWGKMVRRIARWVEFDNSYKTMDKDYMESVWWAFKQIYDKELVYEGRKVLMYCPRCETPVSNFEVAMDNSYKDVTEEAVTVKFKFKKGQKIGKDFVADDRTYILAWTTTPWTLPGNVALAVGKDISYGIYENKINLDRGISRGELHLQEGYYILANDLLNVITEEGNYLTGKNWSVSGRDLVGLEYEPLFEVKPLKHKNSYKVYPAEFVTTTEGTGVVHTAVVYGEEDYELGIRENLPVVPLLNEKGNFNEEGPGFLRGKYFKDADSLVIKDLEKRSLLFKKEKHAHSYPHCWRCENPLFYNAIPAWFINVQKIKNKLVRSNIKGINWFPEHLKRGRYEKSVLAAPDWNISRNRYWGNPIPIWQCGGCGKTEAIGGIGELEKRLPKSTNRYILVRHGQALSNLTHKVTGWAEDKKNNAHLTLFGRIQIEKLAKKLGKTKVDYIYSSDVTRTKETEKILADVFKDEKVYFDKRLREINTGVFGGRHDSEYHAYYSSDLEKFTKRPPEGESLTDLRKRLFEFVSEIEEKHDNKTIVIVSHEYPLWVLEQAMLGWSDEEAVGEKHARGKDFLDTGEAEEISFRKVPRDETGLVDLHRPHIDKVVFACSKCGGKMERIKEIFDSWVETASMPFAEFHYPFENKETFKKRFPAQFVAEYIPQTRAWFYVMHVVSSILFNRAPFENVVTTGTILAEDGSKMSKSKNNFPDPWEVINKYGVDALRFYLMNSAVMQAGDLNFSARDLEKMYRKNVLILWNVYRYFDTYSHAVDWRKSAKSKAKMPVLDVWIRARTKELINSVTERLDDYDTVWATRAIEEYINDLSTWYVRRSRGREDSSFFTTLHDSLLKTSKVIAPFMPYLAEVLYLNMGEAGSVHLACWPKLEKLTNEEKSLIREMNDLRHLASLALAKRAELGIKVRQPLRELRVKNYKSKNKELLATLKEEVNVKEIRIDKGIEEEVRLDTEITHELREEGWLREFKRLVQGLRKDARLEPKDIIVLTVELPQELLYIVQKSEKSVKEDVGAESIEYRRSDKFEAELETKLGEWPVWIALRKPR